MPRTRIRPSSTASVPHFVRKNNVTYHHRDTKQTAKDYEDDLEYDTCNTKVQRSSGGKAESPGNVETGSDGYESDVVGVARVDGLGLLGMHGLDVEREEDNEDNAQYEEDASDHEQTIPVRLGHWSAAVVRIHMHTVINIQYPKVMSIQYINSACL